MKSSEFPALGIHGVLAETLARANFEMPTQIQRQAIPLVLKGRDVVGIAQTGTGKTAAFGLPVLMQILDAGKPAQSGKPAALVLAPTRELAAQIHSELTRFAENTGLKQVCIFGGVKQGRQVRSLQQGLHVLIATPGRLLDLMEQGHVSLDCVRHLVLDEADRLLDLGFARDIKRITRKLPGRRQTLLFSATMPASVAALVKSLLYKPHRIDVSPKKVTVDKIDQYVSFVPAKQKQFALRALLGDKAVSKAIVFTRTKREADRVARKLNNGGVVAEAIHGNKTQNARTRALNSFLSGDAWVLVATDIAARGIDISGISHVINYNLPQDPESYVHRIGRTGRAGASGCAWSLVDDSERGKLRSIEKLTRLQLEEYPVDFGADGEFISGEQNGPAGGKQTSQESRATGDSRSGRRRRRRRPNRKRSLKAA